MVSSAHQMPRESRALEAYIKLQRAASAVAIRASRHLAAFDLTLSQFAVMEALYHLGPLCLSEVARKVTKTSGNLTMVMDNLEKRGLAKRRQRSHDRRFTTVVLTPKGRKLVARAFPEHAVEIASAIGKLSPAEQTHLAALCRKLGLGNIQN